MALAGRKELSSLAISPCITDADTNTKGIGQKESNIFLPEEEFIFEWFSKLNLIEGKQNIWNTFSLLFWFTNQQPVFACWHSPLLSSLLSSLPPSPSLSPSPSNCQCLSGGIWIPSQLKGSIPFHSILVQGREKEKAGVLVPQPLLRRSTF